MVSDVRLKRKEDIMSKLFNIKYITASLLSFIIFKDSYQISLNKSFEGHYDPYCPKSSGNKLILVVYAHINTSATQAVGLGFQIADSESFEWYNECFFLAQECSAESCKCKCKNTSDPDFLLMSLNITVKTNDSVKYVRVVIETRDGKKIYSSEVHLEYYEELNKNPVVLEINNQIINLSQWNISTSEDALLIQYKIKSAEQNLLKMTYDVISEGRQHFDTNQDIYIWKDSANKSYERITFSCKICMDNFVNVTCLFIRNIDQDDEIFQNSTVDNVTVHSSSMFIPTEVAIVSISLNMLLIAYILNKYAWKHLKNPCRKEKDQISTVHKDNSHCSIGVNTDSNVEDIISYSCEDQRPVEEALNSTEQISIVNEDERHSLIGRNANTNDEDSNGFSGEEEKEPLIPKQELKNFTNPNDHLTCISVERDVMTNSYNDVFRTTEFFTNQSPQDYEMKLVSRDTSENTNN
ncbi:hypothetical protein Bpfe_003632 [Biomphalaria pfeifferi]|uniref:Uncharacterized protein n=1 Tax=Biomphalaria pfeifferi TaxID=112525 RepID=A0AAD8C5K4_BIOPF|nr:hypothetical protein Bpfe_003632 [Biomphalaria pfeifferi]